MASFGERRNLDHVLQTVRRLSATLQEKADDLATERQRRFEWFEFAPEACVITAPDGRILETNRAARELLGPRAAGPARRRLAVLLRRSQGVSVRATRPLADGGLCWWLGREG